jgi:uncharacterized membrane protein
MERGLPGLLGSILARVVEALLAVTGLGFTVFGSEDDAAEAIFLASWSAVAIAYLLIGGFRVRRQRLVPEDRPDPAHPVWSRRLSFFPTVAASLTGLGAALDVMHADNATEYGGLITGLGAVVTVCAWMLLSLGYARFYAQWTDWRFPACPHPMLVDFLYFSFTVGVSFAVSDVEVRSRTLRWHVMVHSVLSFFYNAVVLAVAVNVVTGR